MGLTRSPMKRGTSTLKTKSPLKQGAPLRAKAPMKAGSTKKAPATKSTLKTRQRAVTADEKILWSQLAALGCCACMKDGRYNPHVSIHHIDGRTKEGCHKLVLPLCAPHHQQDDTDPASRVAVHPWVNRFERRYGSQTDLLAECMALLSHQNATNIKIPVVLSQQFVNNALAGSIFEPPVSEP